MIKDKIKKYFHSANIPLTEKQADLFALYYTLINENNDDNDLTRIKGEEQFIIKHFLDSVYVCKFVELPESIVDIGTGAGFPGIPLKIMNPSLKLILAEQRKRRCDFLSLAIDELGLEGVEIYPHKVTDKSFFDIDGVITRALEDAPQTLSRVGHFLPKGGQVILLKGPDADGDISALSEGDKSFFELEKDISYTLLDTDFKRRLLVFRKISDSFKKQYKIMKVERDTHGIPITSPENSTFKTLKRIISGDGLKKNELVAVTGKKIIKDFFYKKKERCQRIILPDEYSETEEGFEKILNEFEKKGALYIIRKSLFNELDIGFQGPLLIADMPLIKKWDGSIYHGCNPLIPFQDPLNVGAAVRSAVAFGIKQIILTIDAANPYHYKSIRASSGAVFDVDFVRAPRLAEIYEFIKSDGFRVFALDKNGVMLNQIDFPDKFIVIPGIEGPGLPENLKGDAVSIPMVDDIESLNATVSLSIFMYQWFISKK